MKDREINRITVSDICREAGLNRATFYANFTDVYDLADKIREKLLSDIKGIYGHSFKAKRGDFVPLFAHIRENQAFYRAYFKLGYDSDHGVEFYDAEQARDMFPGENVEFHLAFFKSGLNAIIKLWMEGGCKESPEEMEQILENEYRGRLVF